MTIQETAAASRKTRGAKGFRAGLDAELLASFLLTLKGYRILGLRLRTPFGEVDILAKKRDALVIVEVKRRTTLARSLECIMPEQQRRLANAGQHLAAKFGKGTSTIRCDAFLFGQKGLPRHIKNAFTG
jgi:putative endonuclease